MIAIESYKDLILPTNGDFELVSLIHDYLYVNNCNLLK